MLAAFRRLNFGHATLRTRPRAAARRRDPDRNRAKDRRPLPRTTGAGRDGSGAGALRRAGHPVRSRSGSDALRGTGDPGRRFRRVAAGPPRELDPRLQPRARRGRPHGGGRGPRGAPPRPRHALGRGDRARRHRGAPRPRFCHGRARAVEPAAAPHGDPRRRGSAQRCERPSGLSLRGRRGARHGPDARDRGAALPRQFARKPRVGLGAGPALHAPDAAHHRSRHLGRDPVRRHFRGLDRGREASRSRPC